MPLQQILGAYLEMIDEGKVEIFTEIKFPLAQFFPWEYYQYTQRDIDKSITIFNRLLDAIEHRLPVLPVQSDKIDINYPQPILDEAFTLTSLSSGHFSLPCRRVRFISAISPQEFGYSHSTN
jgi:hypothetical protein